MKTTLEIPDSVYRQIKARAALKGETVRAFFMDAVKGKLAAENARRKDQSGWRTVFGKGPKDSVARVQSIIDEEFSRINAEDWE
jgi:hypothetical protein